MVQRAAWSSQKEGLNDFAQSSLAIGLIGDGASSAFGRLVFFFAVVNLLAQHSSASKVIRPAVQTSRSQDAPSLCQPWLQGSTRYVQLLRHKRAREQIQRDINSVADE